MKEGDLEPVVGSQVDNQRSATQTEGILKDSEHEESKIEQSDGENSDVKTIDEEKENFTCRFSDCNRVFNSQRDLNFHQN